MGLIINMNASGNSRAYFSLKPGGYSHLRELELYGMIILNKCKTNSVADFDVCVSVHR